MARVDLKKIREDYKVSQKKVCEYTQYKQCFVSLMENGKASIPQEFINRLVEALGITNIDDYVIEQTEVPAPKPKENRQPSYTKHGTDKTSESVLVSQLLSVIERQGKVIEMLSKQLEKYESR